MCRRRRLALAAALCLATTCAATLAAPAAASEAEPGGGEGNEETVEITVLPPRSDTAPTLRDELFDLVFSLETAEEVRLLLARPVVRRYVLADTPLARVLRDRLVHPWVAARTGLSLERLAEIHRTLVERPGRVPEGADLSSIPLFPVPRRSASDVAPPAPRGRWTPWGWVPAPEAEFP